MQSQSLIFKFSTILCCSTLLVKCSSTQQLGCFLRRLLSVSAWPLPEQQAWRQDHYIFIISVVYYYSARVFRTEKRAGNKWGERCSNAGCHTGGDPPWGSLESWGSPEESPWGSPLRILWELRISWGIPPEDPPWGSLLRISLRIPWELRIPLRIPPEDPLRVENLLRILLELEHTQRGILRGSSIVWERGV